MRRSVKYALLHSLTSTCLQKNGYADSDRDPLHIAENNISLNILGELITSPLNSQVYASLQMYCTMVRKPRNIYYFANNM